jgi:hypothetical protein
MSKSGIKAARKAATAQETLKFATLNDARRLLGHPPQRRLGSISPHIVVEGDCPRGTAMAIYAPIAWLGAADETGGVFHNWDAPAAHATHCRRRGSVSPALDQFLSAPRNGLIRHRIVVGQP